MQWGWYAVAALADLPAAIVGLRRAGCLRLVKVTLSRYERASYYVNCGGQCRVTKEVVCMCCISIRLKIQRQTDAINAA